MKSGICDALEFLYTDSQVGSRTRRSLVIDVARGGTASAHVLLNDVPVGAKVRLSLSAKGKRRAAGARWFRLVDVPVHKNTGINGFIEADNLTQEQLNPYVTRRAPFRVFDAMEPVSGVFAASAAVQAVRLHLPVPLGAKPGSNEYNIGVAVGEQTTELKLSVRVHAAAIPAVGRDSFKVSNWFSLTNMATPHDLKCWSEAHWRMIARYAKLMVRGRQNTFLLSASDIFTRTAAGLVLDRARLRRIVRTFTSAGLHFIEGPHFAGRKDYGSNTFLNVLDGPPSISTEGNADIAFAAKQLVDEIDRNKWRGRWFQHVGDEPTDGCAAEYRILCGIVRRHMPGIPLLDANCTLSIAGALDHWCPKVHEYQPNRDFYAHQRQTGDKVWYYTCCVPGGKWLNRLLDQELLRPALLGWAGALFGMDGFLHWGLNNWPKTMDPFERSLNDDPDPSLGNWLPYGDTHIVYPGKDGPWPSLRFESHREGFEDVELLHRLQSTNPRAAAAIIKRVMRGFDDYTTDTQRFRSARRAILEALA
jgi:hypothetical protein